MNNYFKKYFSVNYSFFLKKNIKQNQEEVHEKNNFLKIFYTFNQRGTLLLYPVAKIVASKSSILPSTNAAPWSVIRLIAGRTLLLLHAWI